MRICSHLGSAGSVAAGPRDTDAVTKFRIGIRWWLGAVFALIAILTAVLIATVASRQADRDLRANAESIAVGSTVSAGFAIEQAIKSNDLSQQLVPIGGQHGLALFVFSSDRTLIAQSGLRNIQWQDVPRGNAALTSALHDRRFVGSFRGGRTTVVGLPLNRTSVAAALVAYAPRGPAYSAANSIFRTEVLRASVWAVLIATATGLVAAALIARRLRRISRAAQAIEQGDFELELKPGFQDEIGALTGSIDEMRRRLGESFERIRSERDQLELLLEQLQEGVIAVDSDLNVVFANTHARDLLAGVPLDPGTPLSETFAELPLRRIAEALFAPDAPVAEARSRREDGATVSLVGVPASASGLVVLVFADITESERRRKAEREFVDSASHELRTPVTAIVGAVEALEAGARDDPESRDRFISVISRQASRLTRLTTALLTLARAQTQQEPVQLEAVAIRPLLEDVAATAPAVVGVRVRVDCEHTLIAVGRHDILEQVISNLVENAFKHTAAGEITLSGRLLDSNAVIEVADTGTGVPLAAQRRVFDRFYSFDESRQNGFGLGLAIARDSTNAIGGTLTLESHPGRGTVARVILAGSAGA